MDKGINSLCYNFEGKFQPNMAPLVVKKCVYTLYQGQMSDRKFMENFNTLCDVVTQQEYILKTIPYQGFFRKTNHQYQGRY